MGLARGVWGSIKLVGYFARFGVELLVTQPKTRPARAAWLHRFCATAMPGMGVRLTVEGTPPGKGSVISNHLTYVDIVAMAAVQPCVFCSKAELKAIPVLGWMTKMAGTVFVERGRGGSALRAKSGMKAASDAGLPVVFFPEGTTSNGDETKPFHSGLLAQAMESGEPVTAAFLSYTFDEDNGPGVTAREYVCWGDDTGMFTHIWRFLKLRGVHVTIRFADGPIRFTSDTMHRKEAAVEARDAVISLMPTARGAGIPCPF